jgi:hypothetical protein
MGRGCDRYGSAHRQIAYDGMQAVMATPKPQPAFSPI